MSGLKKAVKQILNLTGLMKFSQELERRPERKVVDNYFGKKILSEQDGNELISRLLQGEEPLMIGKIGSVELECINNYLGLKERRALRWGKEVRRTLCDNAGFFPNKRKKIERFAEEFIGHLQNLDVLGVWFNYNEDEISRRFCKDSNLVALRSLEPYYHSNPWSSSLEGKKVLVIHPFEETIRAQYFNKKGHIFNDSQLLPTFELLTMKAVQSNAKCRTQYRDWFDALNYMSDKISGMDFDVALIGAGAYGLPLASFVKSLGKKAVHMGGATQILFGIKGKRWDNHEVISTLYNEYWVRPGENERPHEYQVVEDGCYW